MLDELGFVVNWFLIILMGVGIIILIITIVYVIYLSVIEHFLLSKPDPKVVLGVLMLILIFLLFHYSGVWIYLMEHDNIPSAFHLIPQK